MNVLPLSPQSLELAQNRMRAGTAQPVKMTGLTALAMRGAMPIGDAPTMNAPMVPLVTSKLANVIVTSFALLTVR